MLVVVVEIVVEVVVGVVGKILVFVGVHVVVVGDGVVEGVGRDRRALGWRRWGATCERLRGEAEWLWCAKEEVVVVVVSGREGPLKGMTNGRATAATPTRCLPRFLSLLMYHRILQVGVQSTSALFLFFFDGLEWVRMGQLEARKFFSFLQEKE